MANIKFTVNFTGSIELDQNKLKLIHMDENSNVVNVESDDYSPQEVIEKISTGEFQVDFVETYKASREPHLTSLEVDFEEEM